MTRLPINNYRSKMDNLTQGVGVLMSFALIFGTAVVNVVLFLMLLTYVVGGDYTEKWRRIRANAAAAISLILFGLFVLGMSYSSTTLTASLGTLNKYRELILFPIVISIFQDEIWKRRAYYAFLIAILVGIMVSYAMYFGWLHPGSEGEEWVPFKSRIAYGLFLAYAIYLMCHHLLNSRAKLHRYAIAAVICVAYFNLMFMVSGRTGHVVLLCLMVLLGYQYWKSLKKRLLIAIPLIGVAIMATILTSPAIQSRGNDIQLAINHTEESSIGLRLIMWETTLRVILDHPIFGAGTGSLEGEYSKKAYDHPDVKTGNPHNEYLLIAAQLGLIGLSGFLLLMYRQWKLSAKLIVPYSFATQGLVMAMAVGCLFNSFLYDYGEGHFYAVFAGVLLSGLGISSHGRPAE